MTDKDLETDQNRIILMLAKAGLPYEVYPANPEDPIFGGTEAMVSVTAPGGQDSKVRGYKGFISCFYFDPDGKFITMGCWE